MDGAWFEVLQSPDPHIYLNSCECGETTIPEFERWFPFSLLTSPLCVEKNSSHLNRAFGVLVTSLPFSVSSLSQTQAVPNAFSQNDPLVRVFSPTIRVIPSINIDGCGK